MGEIRRLEYGEKSILEIDYSDLKEEAMIKLVNDLLLLLLRENRPTLILKCYNVKNFLTPKYMRHVEKVTGENIHLIDKMAIVGLNGIQTFILRGYNYMFKRNFRVFDSKVEAIDYLLDESTSDKVVPDFF
jgi:hypothetical protein